MKKNKISGIYLITNKIDNKHYVGLSINCLERFSKHKSLLRRCKHHNQHLQSAWDKYGEESFVFEILEEHNNEYLHSFENFWCNLLDSHNREFGYNIDLTNPNKKTNLNKETIEKIRISNTGREVSIETRNKLRDINLGKKYSDETIEILKNSAKNKSVSVYSKDGSFIKKYKSIRECGRQMSIDSSHICKCIKNKFNIVNGYIFKYSNDILTQEEIVYRNSKSNDSKKVKVIGYKLSGELIGEYNSFYEAGKVNNLDPYKISLCIKGLQKRVKDTIWIKKID